VESKILQYEGEDVVVTYDVKRCIHAGECVRGLPQVFDPEAKPWINPSAAKPTDLLETVQRCPTGALHVKQRDGGAVETPDEENSLLVAADGPLYLRGHIQVLDTAETVILEDARVALCRCGASSHKPFCDGSHAGADFEDAGDLANAEVAAPAPARGATVRVLPCRDGPFLVQGPCTLKDAFGEPVTDADGQALCRCGHSANKPFCDGSHKRIGFRDGG
jgi:CDGSH-type Zn-finger protein/uncharacterized Fe-S cluster protein YjdI